MHMIWICLLAFSASAVNGLRVFEERWAYKCKNVGVEYDSAKDYQRFREFTECCETSLNQTQFIEDANEMIRKYKSTELDFSTIKPTLQKYCSQANAYVNCSKKLSTECFTEEENLRWTIFESMQRSYIDFICENDASGMTEFINGSGIECGMAKELELKLCDEQFDRDFTSAAMSSGDIFILFATIPRAGTLCDLIETEGNCIKNLFQQCELSKIPAKLITDLYNYVETKTKCATIPKIDINLQESKQNVTFLNSSTLRGNATATALTSINTQSVADG